MFGKSLAVFFTLSAAALSASALSIDTPEKLTQCKTVSLKWHGKKGPFTLHVLPSCESESDEPLLVLPPMNATTYDWTVNLPSKTGAVAFAIVDGSGNEAFTDEIDIGKSDDVACLNAASSSSSAVPTTSTGTITSSADITPTTLVVSATSATGTPKAPVNVGAGPGTGSGNSGSASSGNGSGSGSGNSGNPSVSGAITNAASASTFIGAIGIVTGFFVLL